jgi:hypothetical protein
VFLLQLESLFLVELVHGFSHEKIFSLPRGVVEPEDVQERRFSGAGRSHDGKKIALVHFEVDVAESVVGAAFERINAVDVAKGDH